MTRSASPFPFDFLACPVCSGRLEPRDARLGCSGCGAFYEVRDGVFALRLPLDERTEAVRRLYSENPFPGYPEKDSLWSLRARAERSEFARLLDRAIRGDARIVELGCGTGQMTLYLATADRIVIGADLSRASLECAARARARYGVDRAFFVETDLRRPGLREAAFDVVLSSGVLHHTPDPRASFAALARLVKPGGIVVLGLYNVFGRLPHRFRRALSRLTGFRRVFFDPVLRDRNAEPSRRDAWLRDQYLHPEEHRHSLGEVQGWFRENDIEFLRTYPNALIAAEPLREDQLFTAAGDDWWLENLIAQASWAIALAREGGLFVTIGRRAER